MIETPPTPISANVEQLFKEIQDIYGQYKREVPRKRGPWPQAIQSRVLELWKLGIGTHQISESTGLACQTMYSWRQRLRKQLPDGFLPIPVVRRRLAVGERPSSAVSRLESNGQAMTVIISIGDDIRVEGVPVGDVARILREVRGE